MTKTRAAYGSWRSPIDSDLIVGDSIGLADVRFDGDDIYWIESRPREKGRCVIVRYLPDRRREEVNLPPFNARTRVHEYGGGAVAIDRGLVVFSNFDSQRLFRCEAGAEPVALTPAPADPANRNRNLRYADGVIDRRRGLWIGVREDHTHDESSPANTLVAIDLGTGGGGRVVAEGRDFYSSPQLSPDGTQLAWLSWQHPNMPWMETELWVAGISGSGNLESPARVAGGGGQSIFQPQWSPDGKLHFVSDQSGWWNIYRLENLSSPSRLLYRMDAEFGAPQWLFGMSTYGFRDAGRILCSFTRNGIQSLAQLDVAAGQLTPIESPYQDISFVRVRGDRAVFRGGSADGAAAIVLLDLSDGTTQRLQSASDVADDIQIRRHFSTPVHVGFPTTGGLSAHGFYYPPFNADFAGSGLEKPPLLVKCHGGPTAAASSTLDLRTQFWTSRGIAVLDVNYGGSAGHGRDYRNRLSGAWGIVDVEDCINGAKHLVGQGLADAERVVITGASAGGYTVLASLVFQDFFKGGASHYGISDIAALARDTHKFESRYLDWLIGPLPEQEQLYRARSPVYHSEKLTRPVVFFQGEQDRIVPPNQTELMVRALREHNIPVGYCLFTDEGHGFRNADNIKRALDTELFFYSLLVFKVQLTF
jgi:dipeptidyl aminopeptidase/acylaminoacyl peptidase